jgi:transcription elongation factor GreB
MSRAFVQESDDDFSADEVPAIKIPLPPGVKNYMTPAGAQRVKEELHDLLHNEHPRLAAKLKARIHGGGGDVGKERRLLREMERRIEYLTGMVDRIEVVDPARNEPGQVRFGAQVTVLENDRNRRSYTIVGVDESNPSSGMISWISPLARALLSKKIGDTVRLTIQGGEKKIKILDIAYH